MHLYSVRIYLGSAVHLGCTQPVRIYATSSQACCCLIFECSAATEGRISSPWLQASKSNLDVSRGYPKGFNSHHSDRPALMRELMREGTRLLGDPLFTSSMRRRVVYHPPEGRIPSPSRWATRSKSSTWVHPPQIPYRVLPKTSWGPREKLSATNPVLWPLATTPVPGPPATNSTRGHPQQIKYLGTPATNPAPGPPATNPVPWRRSGVEEE